MLSKTGFLWLSILACFGLAFGLVGWTIWSPVTIGNDYVVWPIYPNLVRSFYDSKGVPTIWYPFYTGGFPFGGLPGVQVFHLPTWLLTLIPDYLNGNAIYWNSVKHVLVFTCGHWTASFFISRSLRISFFHSFLLTAPLIYNLRTLDQLRYGIYLEAVVYFQSAMLLAYLYLAKRNVGILIAFGIFVQFCLTAGHPPSLFYGVVIAGFVAVLAFPRWASAEQGGMSALRPLLVPSLHILGVSALSFLLAAPNWWPSSEMLQMNSVRVLHSTLEWAKALPLTWPRLFNNFFMPWETEVHSAFGGSALLTILLASTAIFCLLDLRRYWWAILLLFYPFVFSFGGWLFEFFYYNVPGYKWMRIPGRITAMIPLLMLTILGYGLFSVFGAEGNHAQQIKKRLRLSVVISALLHMIMLVAVSGSVIFDAAWLNSFRETGFSPHKLNGWSEAMRLTWIVAGLATSASIAYMLGKQKPTLTIHTYSLLLVLFITQTYLINRYGTWIVTRYATPTSGEFLTANHLPFHHTAPLIGPIPLDEEVGGMATTGYTRFMKAAKGNADCFLPIPQAGGTRRTLLPLYLTRRLVHSTDGKCGASTSEQVNLVAAGQCSPVSGSLVVASQEVCDKVARNDSSADLIALNRHTKIESLGPSSVAIRAEATSDAVLVTPFPWVDGFWNVLIDGKAAQGFEINGGILGVLIQAGSHHISINYISERTRKARYLVFFATFIIAVLLCFLSLKHFGTAGSIRKIVFIALISAGAYTSYATFSWASSYTGLPRNKEPLRHNYKALLRQQLESWSQQSS